MNNNDDISFLIEKKDINLNRNKIELVLPIVNRKITQTSIYLYINQNINLYNKYIIITINNI